MLLWSDSAYAACQDLYVMFRMNPVLDVFSISRRHYSHAQSPTNTIRPETTKNDSLAQSTRRLVLCSRTSSFRLVAEYNRRFVQTKTD